MFSYTSSSSHFALFFFFNDTATTEIYTLSLHDALPIYDPPADFPGQQVPAARAAECHSQRRTHRTVTFGDRKSTRLNSSHANISYAVFCLKKKKNTKHK